MNYDEQFVLHWKPSRQRPEEGSYVLVKCIDESGRVCCEPCAYENGEFIYIYDSGTWGELNEDLILGWDYFPYDDHPTF